MRRWKKRNHKFWSIVRAKSKRHYGRKKHIGGLRIHGVVKKYHNKGHFDPVSYANSHPKMWEPPKWIHENWLKKKARLERRRKAFGYKEGYYGTFH